MISAADLLALHPTPDPNASEEQFDRYYGLDLPSRTVADLERELTVVQIINWVCDDGWHQQHESRLAGELASRG